ncbi:MAG: ribonuclease H-like domain-containing protein [Candidatus Woesearchaeota archaeon]
MLESERKERLLWKQGIRNWNDFLAASSIKGISFKRKRVLDLQIVHAKKALFNDDIKFFISKIPSKYHYRFYDYYKDSCIFIDIETSGINGYVTCITLYDRINIMTFVKDYNLDFKVISKIISNCKMIVSFNGSVFDIPFLRKYCIFNFPDILHWDLRVSCNLLELDGGLKKVEENLGIKRNNNIVENLVGGDPIKLWRTFKATGDKYYLDLLVEYNQEDTINLETLADKIYPRLMKSIK